MTHVPSAREVDQSLREAQRQAKASLKGVYQQAAKLMGRGRVSEAKAVVAKAEAVKAFQMEIAALRKHWREIRRTGGGRSRVPADRTALWRFYQPILEALVESDGVIRLPQLEERVGTRVKSMLSAGDLETMRSGRPRWHQALKRARRPMAAEGWLETGRGDWKLTAAGRKAAQRGVKQPVSE